MARAGKVRILGGSGRELSALTPDIPSLHEQGVKDFHFDAWFAVWGPLGLPADIVRRYNAVFREVLADPEVRELLAKQGTSVVTSTPEELDRLNREEFEKKWDDLKIFIEYGILSNDKFAEKAKKFFLYKNTDGKYFTIEEYENIIKENQTKHNCNNSTCYTSSMCLFRMA